MPKNRQELADLFGARIIGQLPDVGGGPFGMARLAHLLHQTLIPSQGGTARPAHQPWTGPGLDSKSRDGGKVKRTRGRRGA
jgi:hypothetical protein